MFVITRYEIAARHNDGRAFLVSYSPRKSRPGLLDAMRKRPDEFIEKLSIGETDEIAFSTKPAIHATTGAWWIGFTGRTQIDAKNEGVLPYLFA